MECMTPDKVQEAFLAAPPLISQTILDLTVQHPNWMRDLFAMEEWPRGAGTIMQQLVFRGQMPKIETDLSAWKKMGNLSGCNPCEGPDCSYNWTMFGGHGFERKITELSSRDIRSPEYCINEIQTTANFKEVFAKVVENLYRQVDFFKEMNIGRLVLTSLAKKYVIDSDGAKGNPVNPYMYRAPGAVTLSTLNIGMLEFFYEQMRRMPDVVPYDQVDGAPIYSLLASHQMLSRLYRDDANLRQDVRFSGMANDALTKYNFMSSIRGMFIAAPILYPRRFNVVNGAWVEQLPFVNDVPAEVGSYTYLNPAYESATHEEVIMHGKYPFKIFYMPTETSLGEGTSFGPEFSFLNSWMWVNPQTISDPFRRVGFFATNAKMGVAQQFSEGIFSVLVTRPKASTMAMYTPEPTCPPTPPTCNNSIPAVGCPCPVVLNITPNPFDTTSYYFEFATGITGTPNHAISLVLDNKTTISGEIVQVSADGKLVEISFGGGLDMGACTHITGIACSPVVPCSSVVELASDSRSGVTGHVSLKLANAIRAHTANQVITAYFGDCSTVSLKIVSVDSEELVWNVQYASGTGPTDDPTGAGETAAQLNADMIEDRKGIIKVCVPPLTDATCPACSATLTACAAHQ